MTSQMTGIFYPLEVLLSDISRFSMKMAHFPFFCLRIPYESDIYPVSRCGRHVHLTRSAAMEAFGTPDLVREKDLIQPGQFSTRQTVALHGPNSRQFDHVRLVGPARDYGGYNGQVELSVADAVFLGIEPVVRISGDLDGAPLIEVLGPMGMVEVPAIVPQRHFHYGKKSHLNSRGFRDGDVVIVVPVRMNKGVEEHGMVFGDVVLRYTEEGREELHLHHEEFDVLFDPKESKGFCEVIGLDPSYLYAGSKKPKDHER